MANSLRLKNPVLLMALAAVYPVVSYGAAAARVDFAAGSVQAVAPSGTTRTLGKGAEVLAGETIRTGDDGRAQLRFADGALMSLQPKTEFRIDAYSYSGPGATEDRGFFALLKGGLRTITGLIGRSNRDAYRVTTQVATIGIRGTEYSVGYTNTNNDAILVHTGEGRIEVCNAAGCVLVSGGESAFVGGSSQAPVRTGSVPLLLPAQPAASEQVVYALGETRTAAGGLPPVSPPLPAGSNYTVAFAGIKGGSPFSTFTAPENGAAAFSAASELQQLSNGASNWQAGTVAGAFVADGVIGWGVWKTGTLVNTTSTYALADMHYVTGVPTSPTDMLAMAGINATYALVGYTLPTTSTGVVGSDPVTGTLTAQFGGTLSSLVTADLVVPVAGNQHKFSGSVFTAGTSPNFGGTVASCVNCSNASISGFFAGQNASHAGLTYQFTSSNGALGTVSGAAAFRR